MFSFSDRVEKSALKTWSNFKTTVPVFAGVVLLISMAVTAIPKTFYSSFFSGNLFLDPLVGAVAGSIAAGNPVTSYVLGGEFLSAGASLVAVTAFILAWVTVGAVQLPAESVMLGRKFALTRNAVSFALAILIAVLTVLTLSAVA